MTELVTSSSKPRMFYGWTVVGICFLTLAIGGTTNGSFSVFYVAILDTFDWSRANTAGAFSLSMLVFSACGPLVGWLFDKFGARKVMPIGVVILTAGVMGSSLITSLWHLYFFYGFLLAVGVTHIGFIPNVLIISNWFFHNRALALGIANAGRGVGALILLPLIQYAIQVIGWRNTYLFLGLLVFIVLFPLLAIFQRGHPADKGLTRLGEPNDGLAPKHETPQNKNGPTLGEALKSYRFWTLVVVGIISGIGFSGLLVHAVAYIRDVGFSSLFAATIFGLSAAFRSGGGILGGYFSDRFGRELGVTIFSLLTAFGTIFLIFADSEMPIILYTFAILHGLGSGATGTISSSLKADIFHGKNFGIIFGWIQTGTGIGAAIGPWLFGLIYDRTGNYFPALQGLLVVYALTIVGTWVAAPRKVRPIARADRNMATDSQSPS